MCEKERVVGSKSARENERAREYKRERERKWVKEKKRVCVCEREADRHRGKVRERK